MKAVKFTLILLCLPLVLFCQKRWETGLSLGATTYQGDLVTSSFPNFKETNLAIGVFGRYRLQDQWSIRTNLLFGKLSGDDWNFPDEPSRISRAFSFETSITEFSIQGEWEPWGVNRFPREGGFRKSFSPYLYFGIGGVSLDINTNYLREEPSADNLANIQTDQQNAEDETLQFLIPFGIGLRYDLNPKSVVGLELGMRTTFSDYLDGVSESGNPDANDWYLFGGINFSLRFGQVDSDGDGIVDKKDTCPTLRGVANLNGCPDSDEDGVEDKRDRCPLVAGEIKLKGCPDRDKDGVADNQDACPNTVGFKELNGCPDLDRDGVTDAEDRCPRLFGSPSLQGCPDTDEDGIIDPEDECPQEAGIDRTGGCPTQDTDGDSLDDDLDKCPYIAGKPSLGGCPDTDGDNIPDPNDRCPNTAGNAFNEGCPDQAVVSKDEQEVLVLAAKDVQFETASSSLKVESYITLDKILSILLKYPDYLLKISGHTDKTGDSAKNQILSELRAKACYDYFLSKEIEPQRLFFVGYGEAYPIGDNDTNIGRQLNRRVEFELFIR